jgi:pheromone shutdown protein TraB
MGRCILKLLNIGMSLQHSVLKYKEAEIATEMGISPGTEAAKSQHLGMKLYSTLCVF